MFSLVVLCLAMPGQSLASAILDATAFSDGAMIRAVNAAAAGCTLYTVQPDDTCMSIAWNNSISYAQIINWNPDIDSACSTLASLAGDTICISNPNGSTYALTADSTTTVLTGATTAAPIPSPILSGSNTNCGEWYQVASGQDCGTIELAFSISLADFLFLNTEVWENCTNLEANVYYCVEPVGSISTYSGYGSTATATQTFVPTSFTSVPWRSITANYTTTNPVVPLANGTRTDCAEYLVISSDNYAINPVTNCWAAAMTWDTSPVDFVLWNPSLDQNYSAASTAVVTATASSDYTYPCTLSSSMSYCIQLASATAAATTNTTAPSPRASGEASNCTEWGYVYSFTDCSSILSLYDLTIAELYAMNPSVGTDCTGMAEGTYYCVSWFANGINPDDWGYQYASTVIPTATSTTAAAGDGVSTPSPVQTGIVSDCDQFYYVQQNDNCYGIAQDYAITLDQFYAWNPAVDDCAALDYGYYVCVGVLASSSTAATTTSTTASTAGTTSSTAGNTITTPVPTQSGMVSNCDKFYDVVPNDGCYDIAASYGIALTDFYNWNLGVSSCADLYPSYYVCVGIATTDVATTGAAKRTAPSAPVITSAP